MMEINFNKLTPAEAERLAILAEECGEVVQTVGKILRHGFEEYSPKDETKTTNRTYLERELGDLECIVGIMHERGDLSVDRIDDNCEDKLDRISKYLHYNDVSDILNEKAH